MGNERKPGSFGIVFAVVGAGIAMVNMDLFIANVALPSIGRAFGGADLASLSWVLNAYAIIFAALLVPAGRLADRMGRRAAFLIGVVVFALSSAWCAGSTGVWELVAARVVQAAGGALMMPASLGLLLAVAPPDKRHGAIRGWTAIGGLAASLGPVIGGLLVEVSWHWVFLVNVPIAAVTLFAGLRVLPRLAPTDAERHEPRPDMAGAAILTLAIGILALALTKTDGWGWGSPRVLGLIALAIVLSVILVRRSARHVAPVIEPALLRQPMFGLATLANVVFGMAFGAMLLLVTLWCQDIWGWSALRAGLAFAPGPLMVPFLSVGAGPLAKRVGPGPVAAAGCLIYACGCVFWRLNLSLAPDYPAHMLPGVLMTGVGVGLTLPTLVSAGVAAVPPARFATGSGIVTMARQLGIVIGVALLVTVLATPTRATAVTYFGRSFVLTASLAAAAGLASLLLVLARKKATPAVSGSAGAPAGLVAELESSLAGTKPGGGVKAERGGVGHLAQARLQVIDVAGT
ncbi:MAG TPA: MFS transporter [Trebonia sp.]|nr:MFS transporter [Trebonia sp.]